MAYATYAEFPAPAGANWFDVFRTLIPTEARVGVESAMPIGIFERTPGTKVVVDVIEEARLVKTPYEIARNVHACQIVTAGHEKLLQLCRPGVPEAVIYGGVTQFMMAMVFRDIPTANIMVTNAKAAVWPPSISFDPHRIPSLGMPMENGGPLVSIVTAQVDRLWRGVGAHLLPRLRPRVGGGPLRRDAGGAGDGVRHGAPGAILAEIDRAVRAVIARHGYGDCILHRTGHGFGITGHEGPYVALGDERALREGMLISIEPGIYVAGRGGFRHSDTVLITADGCVSLTQAPETLEALTIA
ncbi:MAG: aminopeptidase P family protein [Gemmatimonadetes bacterium]|nr:aminopeptidase P family protein [Gemmatimonadota bacterium]